MNKKRYYRLLNEYERISRQREFNQNFYDIDRFMELRRILIKQYSYSLKLITDEIIICKKQFHNGNWFAEKRICELEKCRYMHGKLLDKIENKEMIAKEDYENSFFEVKILGVFTRSQVLIYMLVISLIYFIYNMSS